MAVSYSEIDCIAIKALITCFHDEITINSGSGDLVLMNPTNIDWWTHRLFSYENVTTNAFNGTYFKIPPKEGTLLLFPSYVPHMVEPNTSDVNRISISFNLG